LIERQKKTTTTTVEYLNATDYFRYLQLAEPFGWQQNKSSQLKDSSLQ